MNSTASYNPIVQEWHRQLAPNVPIGQLVEYLNPTLLGLENKAQFYAPIQFAIHVAGPISGPAGALRLAVPVYKNPEWLPVLKARIGKLVGAPLGATIDLVTLGNKSIASFPEDQLHRIGKLNVMVDGKRVRLATLPSVPVEYATNKVASISSWYSDVKHGLPELLANEFMHKSAAQLDKALSPNGTVKALIAKHIADTTTDWTEFVRVHHMNSPYEIHPAGAQKVLDTVASGILTTVRDFVKAAAPSISSYLASIESERMARELAATGADYQPIFGNTNVEASAEDGYELYFGLASSVFALPSVERTVSNTIYIKPIERCRWTDPEFEGRDVPKEDKTVTALKGTNGRGGEKTDTPVVTRTTKSNPYGHGLSGAKKKGLFSSTTKPDEKEKGRSMSNKKGPFSSTTKPDEEKGRPVSNKKGLIITKTKPDEKDKGLVVWQDTALSFDDALDKFADFYDKVKESRQEIFDFIVNLWIQTVMFKSGNSIRKGDIEDLLKPLLDEGYSEFMNSNVLPFTPAAGNVVWLAIVTYYGYSNDTRPIVTADQFIAILLFRLNDILSDKQKTEAYFGLEEPGPVLPENWTEMLSKNPMRYLDYLANQVITPYMNYLNRSDMTSRRPITEKTKSPLTKPLEDFHKKFPLTDNKIALFGSTEEATTIAKAMIGDSRGYWVSFFNRFRKDTRHTEIKSVFLDYYSVELTATNEADLLVSMVYAMHNKAAVAADPDAGVIQDTSNGLWTKWTERATRVVEKTLETETKRYEERRNAATEELNSESGDDSDDFVDEESIHAAEREEKGWWFSWSDKGKEEANDAGVPDESFTESSTSKTRSETDESYRPDMEEESVSESGDDDDDDESESPSSYYDPESIVIETMEEEDDPTPQDQDKFLKSIESLSKDALMKFTKTSSFAYITKGISDEDKQISEWVKTKNFSWPKSADKEQSGYSPEKSRHVFIDLGIEANSEFKHYIGSRSMVRARAIALIRKRLGTAPTLNIEAHHPWNAQIHHTLKELAGGVYPEYYNMLHTRQDMTENAPYKGNLEDTYNAYHMFSNVHSLPIACPASKHTDDEDEKKKKTKKAKAPIQGALPKLIPLTPIACGQSKKKEDEDNEEMSAPIRGAIPKLIPLEQNLPKLIPIQGQAPKVIPIACGHSEKKKKKNKDEEDMRAPIQGALPKLIPIQGQAPKLIPIACGHSEKKKKNEDDEDMNAPIRSAMPKPRFIPIDNQVIPPRPPLIRADLAKKMRDRLVRVTEEVPSEGHGFAGLPELDDLFD